VILSVEVPILYDNRLKFIKKKFIRYLIFTEIKSLNYQMNWRQLEVFFIFVDQILRLYRMKCI
jgi:hypothetical protein